MSNDSPVHVCGTPHSWGFVLQWLRRALTLASCPENFSKAPLFRVRFMRLVARIAHFWRPGAALSRLVAVLGDGGFWPVKRPRRIQQRRKLDYSFSIPLPELSEKTVRVATCSGIAALTLDEAACLQTATDCLRLSCGEPQSDRDVSDMA